MKDKIIINTLYQTVLRKLSFHLWFLLYSFDIIFSNIGEIFFFNSLFQLIQKILFLSFILFIKILLGCVHTTYRGREFKVYFPWLANFMSLIKFRIPYSMVFRDNKT